MTVVKQIESCPSCPLSLCGVQWHSTCMALKESRPLPKDHDLDGPPPEWCPLPVIVERAT